MLQNLTKYLKDDRVKRLMKESMLPSAEWRERDAFAHICGSHKSEIVDSIPGVRLQTYFITPRALFARLSGESQAAMNYPASDARFLLSPRIPHAAAR